MSNLSQNQRQYLRRIAHDLKPLVHVGKNGLTPGLISSTVESLVAHELIKVKLLGVDEERKEIAEELAQRSGSELIAVVGNVAILYRRQPDAQRRKVELPLD